VSSRPHSDVVGTRTTRSTGSAAPCSGVEHLPDRQRARLDKWLLLGDPNSEIEVTWHVYQQVPLDLHRHQPRRRPQDRREGP
jgi:hypothetical protein